MAVVAAVVLSLLYFYLRIYRLRHPQPKWVPTSFLKSKWQAWNPLGSYGRIAKPSSSHHDDNGDTPLETAPSSTQINTSSRTLDVDRRISVRSIVSLPPYHSNPLPTEQIIAREGERGGVDTVIEFPETEEEAEAQREEEMETLYSIREARRREHAEREERRRQRQEAREQHDWARLEQIEQESRARARARARAASAGSSATTLPQVNDVGLLIAELASQRESRRDRRVSSVSYADLGLARHDGSRIRADSIESDNQPLLSSAASMGNSNRGSRQHSPFGSSSHIATSHRRGPSDMSIVSTTSSRTSLDRPITRTATNPDDLHLTPQSSTSTQINLNDPEADLGTPPTEPPSYEAHLEAHDDDAPPYESPVVGRGEGPRLPEVSMHLPAIEIRSATPVNSVPATPIMERGRRQLG